MRIGVLTGGGDCPGLNAVIRAVVRKGIDGYGDVLVGFRDGWRGVLDDCVRRADDRVDARDPAARRDDPRQLAHEPLQARRRPRVVAATLDRHGLDGLIAIGGEDTLGVANHLFNDGVNVIGVPKTIDNDLGATDVTFGFDTALHVATEAIDRLHTTAESHHRILVVEVMGRTAGWIALHSGIAGGADVILIPELPFDIDEVCLLIDRRHERGRPFSIVVAAEGASPLEGTMDVASGATVDEFGHPRLGGIGYVLEREIEQRTGYETRATVLGHTQRGGTPTAFDRVLATRLGLRAIDAAHEGAWGTMTALRATEIELVALAEAVASVRHVPVEEYRRYGVLFG